LRNIAFRFADICENGQRLDKELNISALLTVCQKQLYLNQRARAGGYNAMDVGRLWLCYCYVRGYVHERQVVRPLTQLELETFFARQHDGRKKFLDQFGQDLVEPGVFEAFRLKSDPWDRQHTRSESEWKHFHVIAQGAATRIALMYCTL